MLRKAILNKIKLKKKERRRRVISQLMKQKQLHPIHLAGGGGVVQGIQVIVRLYAPTIFRVKRTNANTKLVRDWPKKQI